MTINRKDRRVFLGMPGYGECSLAAAGSFWRGTRLPDSQVYRVYQEGSLLAQNFNKLWCDALNVSREGRRFNYFAMQHSDVEPQLWWLDTMIDELEDRGLDILGAVVPIKDVHGLTSIALQRPDGDTWRPLCRLTMDEVYRLPLTFTSEDVGHPILLNTGLWVSRFDEEWARKVHFTINDRIAQDANGIYHAQCEPEDWFFSRLCHELGLKIGATRKVPLTHRGVASFTNIHPWGDQTFDSGWIDKSPLPETLPEAFRFPMDIEGWLSPWEGEALANLARGKRVLEVGSYCGLSTVCLARTAELVVSFDPHDGRATPSPQDTLVKLQENLARYGVGEKVEIHPSEFAGAESWEWPARFDLVFIDGAHDLESVKRDIACALEVIGDGGLLVFHDYGTTHPDVTAAVDSLVESGGDLLDVYGSLAVVRPPAVIPLEV